MGSPSRNRSSKQSGARRRYRSRSRSLERDYRRDRRSKSRSPSKYSRSRSSRSSSKHKSSSSRRRYRSSSSSSYSSDSRDYKRSPSPEQKKPAKKVQEKIVKPIPEPEVKLFESVNALHDKDTKAALDDLEQEEFVPKTFSSSKRTETDSQPVPDPKKLLPEDSLLHYALFGDDEARMEKWIKKLYNYRQKASADMDTR